MSGARLSALLQSRFAPIAATSRQRMSCSRPARGFRHRCLPRSAGDLQSSARSCTGSRPMIRACMRRIAAPSSSGCTERTARRSMASRAPMPLMGSRSPPNSPRPRPRLTTWRAPSATRRSHTYETHIRGRLRNVLSRSVSDATCLYTSTVDGRFVIGRHHDSSAVTLVSACSGHGFKHSAAIGEAIAESLLGRTPRVSLSEFGLFT